MPAGSFLASSHERGSWELHNIYLNYRTPFKIIIKTLNYLNASMICLCLFTCSAGAKNRYRKKTLFNQKS